MSELQTLAEQIESLHRKRREILSVKRRVSPPKWDWKPGDICFLRCHAEVYEDTIASVSTNQEIVRVAGQSAPIHLNYVFETREEAERHTMEQCVSERLCGYPELRRLE